MDGCSRPQPKRSPPLPPIASTSAPTLASLLSCTAGARTSSTILMFTVSFRAAAYRRTASDGLPAGPASFCQFACSRACSGVCSCRVSKPCMLRASYSSLPISPLSRTRTSSEPTSHHCKRPNGSSMPKNPSPVLSRSWLISRATRIASRLLTAACSILTRPMSVSAGRTIGRARRFLLHVLPNGFHRIRHYGLFANTHRADKLALCRSLLDVPSAPTDRHDDDSGPSGSNHELPPCPCCGGRMITIEVFDGPLSRPSHVRRLDGL